MAKQVGESKALRIYGPYAPGRNSPVPKDHLMLRIVGDGIDKVVYVDNDDLRPAMKIVRRELRRRLALHRHRMSARKRPRI